MPSSWLKTSLSLLPAACGGPPAAAPQQKIPVNYGQSKAGNYSLPDPLATADGRPAASCNALDIANYATPPGSRSAWRVAAR
jgi:hypothetical protein